MATDARPGWSRRPLAELADYINGFGFSPDQWAESGLPIVRIENMRDAGAEANFYDGTLPDRFKVGPGDLLLSWSATLMALVWDRPPAWVNQHIFKVVPRPSVDRSYLHHLLAAALEELAGQSHGTTMKHVKRSDLLPFQVWVAPASEQPRIGRILDTLDEAIRSSERLIAKLEQMKRGLLQDLLTRGIDQDGQPRDPLSPRERWLETPIGLIPDSWALSSVDAEFGLKAGITLGPERKPRRDASPYLRVGNVYRSRLDLTDVALLQASVSERADYSLRVGDLLIVEGHANPHEIGRCAIVTEPAAGLLYQNHLFRLRPKLMAPEFCELWLNSAVSRAYWHRTCSSSSGLNTINSKQLRTMPIARPPLDEQLAIVRAGQAASQKIRSEERGVHKLYELRAGLMDDLLTGRVRVNVGDEDAA